MYTNAQSIKGKIQELSCVANDLKPDLILLTETWCNSGVDNAFLSIDGYNLAPDLRRDRQDTAEGVGGGLLVYARMNLEILPCDNKNDFNQYCKFIVRMANKDVHCYLVYRPPGAAKSATDLLAELLLGAEQNCVILGDFNLPDIDWEECTASSRARNLLEASNERGLNQMINFPTHIKGNILDLIFTDRPDSVISVEEHGRLGRSDHVIVLLTLEGR